MINNNKMNKQHDLCNLDIEDYTNDFMNDKLIRKNDSISNSTSDTVEVPVPEEKQFLVLPSLMAGIMFGVTNFFLGMISMDGI